MNKLNILVVRTDFLGDCILSAVTLDLLKQSFNCNIDVLSTTYSKDAFLYNPNIRNLYIINHNPSDKKILDNGDVLSKIVEEYDLVIVLNRDLRNYSYLKNIKFKSLYAHRLGRKSLKSNFFCIFKGFFPKYNFLEYNQQDHEVANQVALIYFIHKKMLTNQVLDIPKSYKFFYSKSIVELHNKIPKSIVINISGRFGSFKYLNDSFVCSMVYTLLRSGYKLGLIAMKSDLERLNRILESLNNSDGINIIVEDNIHDVAKRIDEYEIFLGCDGGLVHVAAGLGLKVVAVFHNQNTKCWHPWTDKYICIQAVSKNIYDVSFIDIINAVERLSLGYE